jgi:hypothetical protein
MKTKLMIIALLLLGGCTKQSEPVNDYLVADYFYRLAIVDLDSTVKYSPIVTTKVTLEIASESNDENKNYCKLHPNSPMCKALPVTLEYFMLSKDSNVVTLVWKSAIEDNFDKYVVERCRDAVNYKPIATIKAKGPGVYVYKDVFK